MAGMGIDWNRWTNRCVRGWGTGVGSVCVSVCAPTALVSWSSSVGGKGSHGATPVKGRSKGNEEV